MQTILVWMLISVSYGGQSHGNTTVVGHFKTQQMCEHVSSNLPSSHLRARCIQTEVVVTK